jgi:hypothetical protein
VGCGLSATLIGQFHSRANCHPDIGAKFDALAMRTQIAF